MNRITRTVRINAPVEKVFTFLSDPKHLPEIWPNVLEVKSVKKATKGSYDFEWAYKMSGLKLESKFETVEFTPNQRLVWESTKGFECTLRWRFLPEGGLTGLALEMEYTIPSTVLKRAKQDVILQENEHEFEALSENIKSKVELEIAYA